MPLVWDNHGCLPLRPDDGDTLDYVEPEAMPAIADALSRSGFARPEIDKVMGLNWLRVAEEVWI